MFRDLSFGFCLLDLPMLVLAAAILTAIIVHNRRFKRKREELQREIDTKNRK